MARPGLPPRALDSVARLTQEIQLKHIEFADFLRENIQFAALLREEIAISGASAPPPPAPLPAALVEEDWNYLEAQLYWLKQRAYPNDTVNWKAYTAAYAAKLKMSALKLLLPPGVSGPAPAWENIGPTNLQVPYRKYYGEGSTSGRVNAVAYSPVNPNLLLLGSAGGGLWKSDDRGQTWTPLGDTWDNTKVSSVVVSPDNSIYVGTGDFDGGRSVYGFGVKKSTDGGAHWTGMLRNELKGFSVRRIVINPDDPNVVIVAAGNNPFSYGRLFRSQDAGANWTELHLADADWSDGSCGAKAEHGWRYCFVVGDAFGGEIWRTEDAGKTWNKLTAPLSAQFQYLTVTTSLRDPQVVYLFSGTDKRLFKSVDAGKSWSDLTASVPGGYNFSQADYDRVLACSVDSRTSEDVVLLGLIDIVASFDGGTTWTSLGHTYQDDAFTHNDQHAIAVNPKNPAELLIGNDGGIYRVAINLSEKTALFDTTLNAGLTITQFYRAAFHPSDSNRLLGGAQDNATPLAAGNLKSWRSVAGGDGGFAAINPAQPDIQYATEQNLVILETTENWNSAADISGNWGQEVRSFIAPIALDPNNPQVLYAGTTYLWKRDETDCDKANEAICPWTAHLGDQMLAADDGKDALTYIVIAPRASNQIYTGSQEGQLWMTSDGGQKWKRIDGGLPKFWITSIVVNPDHPTTILVSLSGTGAPDGTPHPGHLWICDDASATRPRWRLVVGTGATALPNIPINSVALDPANSKLIYYAGTDIGFFASKDGGATWQDASTSLGLPNVQVDDVQYVPGTGYLMVATFGRGIWRIRLPIDLKPSLLRAQPNFAR